MKKRRIFSVLLTVLFCIGILPTVSAEIVTLKPPIDGATELLTNCSFENGSIKADDWNPKTWGDTVKISTTEHHSGSQSVQLTGAGSYVSQFNIPVVPGAEYQVSAWVKRISVSNDKGPYVKFEFYDTPNTTCLQQDTQSFIDATTIGEWSQVAARIKAPLDAIKMSVLFRLSGEGEVYYDDVSLYITAPPDICFLDTDETFYYTGAKGTASVLINAAAHTVAIGDKLVFRILDGSTELATETIPAENNASYSFDTKLLSEIGKEYIVEVAYTTENGTVLETQRRDIYRYDRPRFITEDGRIEDDRQSFVPIDAYGIKDDEWDYAKDVGCTVHGSIIGTTVQQQWDALEKAKENGLKGVVCLYRNMQPAGSPDNEEYTREIVNKVKDHPALFAYHIMDEPYSHDAPEVVTQNLKKSYKLIRDIDPEHPVWLVEAAVDERYFKEAGKHCDIFWVDPYPAGKDNLNKCEETVEKARKAVNYEKPVCSLVQAFEYKGFLPSANDMRYQLYGSLFGGADGYGYFKFHYEDPPHLYEYDEPDGMWTGITAYASTEQEDVFDLFIKGDLPIINALRSDTLNHVLYAKNNVPYLIVMNKTNVPQHVKIPLESPDKTIRFGGFSATPIDISGATEVSGADAFEADIAALSVAKYRLSCAKSWNFSGMETMRLRDFLAENEKEKLMSNGGFEVVESKTVNGVTFDWATDWNYVSDSAVTASSVCLSGSDSRISIADEGRYGGKALKLQTPQYTPSYRVYKTISGLEGGKTYELSAWVKTVGEQSGRVYLMSGGNSSLPISDFYNGTRTSAFDISRAETGGTWKKLTTVFALPEDETTACLVLAFHTEMSTTEYQATGGNVYGLVDDVSLVPAAPYIVEFFDDDGNELVALSKSSTTTVMARFLGTNGRLTDTHNYECLVAVYSRIGDTLSLQNVSMLPAVTMEPAGAFTYDDNGNVKTYYAPTVVQQYSEPITVEAGQFMKAFIWQNFEPLMPGMILH